jgi:hypothetical protein
LIHRRCVVHILTAAHRRFNFAVPVRAFGYLNRNAIFQF